MKRFHFGALFSVLALVLATTAQASSVHFKSFRQPVLKDNGLTATITGALAGLGNGDVLITVSAQGVGTTRCRNQGGNEAPGQNKVPLLLTGTQTISASEIKNGTVSFRVTTQGPAAPTAAEAGCPNSNWAARFVDVAFTGYTITVQQGGETVLSFTSN